MHAAPRTCLRAPWPITSAFAALCVAALATMPAQAQATRYELDPVHTRIAFQVSHAGFSNPVGTFSGIEGSLHFDGQDWQSASVTVRVPVATLDLGDARWRERMLDRTFFDAKRFPEARFVSTRVEPTGPDSARITGDLTLRGVTRPVTLEARLNALKRHPLTRKRTAGFSATAMLSRREFGMDAWKSLVGDEVRLVIEVEAIRSNEGADHGSGRAGDEAPAERTEDGEPEPEPTDEQGASDAAAQ